MVKKKTEKSSLLSHEHPMYAWAALAICSLIIVGLAGWYLLVYQQGLDDELLLVIKQNNITKQVSSDVSSPDINTTVSEIDASMDSVSESDFSAAELSDESLQLVN